MFRFARTDATVCAIMAFSVLYSRLNDIDEYANRALCRAGIGGKTKAVALLSETLGSVNDQAVRSGPDLLG